MFRSLIDNQIYIESPYKTIFPVRKFEEIMKELG